MLAQVMRRRTRDVDGDANRLPMGDGESSRLQSSLNAGDPCDSNDAIEKEPFRSEGLQGPSGYSPGLTGRVGPPARPVYPGYSGLKGGGDVV
ncbi:MAG: hypothetical protein ACKVX7_14375 [Planctomycetota bacterium]